MEKNLWSGKTDDPHNIKVFFFINTNEEISTKTHLNIVDFMLISMIKYLRWNRTPCHMLKNLT